MAITFEHRVLSVDGDTTITFGSKAVHPDAGVAWPWHHALHALTFIEPLDTNPIRAHFGDRIYDDDVTKKEHPTIFASVKQTKTGKKSWQTTVTMTERSWMPPVAPGFTWSSAA